MADLSGGMIRQAEAAAEHGEIGGVWLRDADEAVHDVPDVMPVAPSFGQIPANLCDLSKG